MRTLYVVTHTPVPEHSGHSRRIAANFRALRSLGECRLLLLGYKPPLAARRELYGMGAAVYPPRVEGRAAKLVRHARAMARGESAWTAKALSPSRLDELRDEARAFGPEAVVLGDTWLSPLVGVFRPLARAVVVDNHNVESRLYRRMAAGATGAAKLRALATAVNMGQMERRLAEADAVWATSDEDARHFERLLGPGRVAVAPNVVEFPGREPVPEEPGTVAYVGSYGYPPNANAALALARVSGILAAAGTPHRVWLVGMDPTPAMLGAARANPLVTVTGLVPSTADYVARCSVFAAPIEEGSGTKFKILEAMGLGRAIVTTPVGAEGLGLRDGETAVITRGDHAFAEAVSRLLRDPGERARLGAAARRHLEENFTPRALAGRIAASLRAATLGGTR